LLLGGADNSLAVARSLRRYGVVVRVFTHAESIVRYSRSPAEVQFPAAGEPWPDFWDRVLCRPDLHGSIVLCCSDDAMMFVAGNRQRYEGNFVFEENRPELQLQLLDKQATIELARSTGIDTPAVYYGRERIAELDWAALRYPLLVKPIHSHLYQKRFGAKLKMVANADQLDRHLAEVRTCGVDVMLCEFIPGPDCLLCSYYSYFDERGAPLFHFTKRVIRREPENFGAGCYHMTDDVPDAVAAGLRFFQGIGFRGLANVEFKRDLRDGQLKLIEANARFTAAHQLLVSCGMDTARIVYDRLAGNEVCIPRDYVLKARLWYPLADFRAFRGLRRAGKISFWQWVRSVSHRQTFPHFELFDPVPAVVGSVRAVRDAIGSTR
jgi:predicted ATP-grasp superfamily ATP-dependent carboligase